MKKSRKKYKFGIYSRGEVRNESLLEEDYTVAVEQISCPINESNSAKDQI